ncbi:Zn ribbon nucleic-acid-binding protein [Thermocatellispora tengchongensis]|uniref:Zn ribbon nucleic-acid-binding protein n=1 Tax=Thermocatellispora tengchongensis TaxID=1073253 RepID=A0A840NWU7_9ACTN|nr:hypothetical protein [Thermocatellispora tengchongensis]MBB5130666.1 Zn ribbon nucleic-acid-binding protein [Thermocatellispora tengchongensis]
MKVVLYGLSCAVCEAEDQLWQDVVRGFVECRACGHRALVAGADETDEIDPYEVDPYEVEPSEDGADPYEIWEDGEEFDPIDGPYWWSE